MTDQRERAAIRESDNSGGMLHWIRSKSLQRASFRCKGGLSTVEDSLCYSNPSFKSRLGGPEQQRNGRESLSGTSGVGIAAVAADTVESSTHTCQQKQSNVVPVVVFESGGCGGGGGGAIRRGSFRWPFVKSIAPASSPPSPTQTGRSASTSEVSTTTTLSFSNDEDDDVEVAVGKVCFNVEKNVTYHASSDFVLDSDMKSQLWWTREEQANRVIMLSESSRNDKSAHAYLVHSHQLSTLTANGSNRNKNNEKSMSNADDLDLANAMINCIIGLVRSGVDDGYRGLEWWLPEMQERRRRWNTTVVMATIRDPAKPIVDQWGEPRYEDDFDIDNSDDDDGGSSSASSTSLLLEQADSIRAHCRAVALRWGRVDSLAAWTGGDSSKQLPAEV